MPTNLKFVQFFGSSAGFGWSEIHYRVSPSTTPDLKSQVEAFYINVGLPRAQILGEDCLSLGARVSYPRDGAIASKVYDAGAPGFAGQKGASWASSLAVNFYDSTFTKNKTVHVRGFWDSVEKNEIYLPAGPEAEGWLDRFNIWKQALIDGSYGWLSKDVASSAAGVVTTYVADANDIVTFTLAGTGMPVATVGTVQLVRFSKINRSNSVLNRQMLVEVVSQTQLRTVNQIATGPFGSKGRFNFRATAFVPYAGINAVSLGKRAMGKAIGHSPGRAKARPLT